MNVNGGKGFVVLREAFSLDPGGKDPAHTINSYSFILREYLSDGWYAFCHCTHPKRIEESRN